ncbi:MAG: phenylacetic acid degradation operon negative regulatory protein PaaX [Woeseiaceae bacterium]|nr:phenylacetic acid degradation operon negative regulatory protein PaaX [Woeseiaceae bacterium]
MSVPTASDKLLDEFRSRPTIRAGSLIITVFGDAIAPRGGTVWIGSLINALSAFGVSERLVRTSVFRLVRDDWLDVDQVGRRSYYRLTDEGARRFEQATRRIYGEPRQSWTGDWCLVLLTGLEAEHRELLRKELGWQGFAAISSNLLAHPSHSSTELERTLKSLDLERDVVVMQGRTLGKNQDAAMRALVHKSWNLDEIDRHYESFIAQFRPVWRAVEKTSACKPQAAFEIRTLMIHEYRRTLLRDPLLPAEMLPPGWHGTAAYQLCRNLYRLVYRQADDYLTAGFETADGPLPPPAPEFFRRFGGLD